MMSSENRNVSDSPACIDQDEQQYQSRKQKAGVLLDTDLHVCMLFTCIVRAPLKAAAVPLRSTRTPPEPLFDHLMILM